MTAGREVAGPLLKELKREPIPQVTGTLAKSFAKKVKAYASTNSVFIAVGVKRQRVTVTQYKDYHTGEIRRWAAGAPKRGPKIAMPSKYAHLAGPKRKSDLIKRVMGRTASTVKAIFVKVLRDEVAKR